VSHGDELPREPVGAFHYQVCLATDFRNRTLRRKGATGKWTALEYDVLCVGIHGKLP
jgi:hypothetical protein